MPFRGAVSAPVTVAPNIDLYRSGNVVTHTPFLYGTGLKSVPEAVSGGGGGPAVPTSGQVWPRGNY